MENKYRHVFPIQKHGHIELKDCILENNSVIIKNRDTLPNNQKEKIIPTSIIKAVQQGEDFFKILYKTDKELMFLCDTPTLLMEWVFQLKTMIQGTQSQVSERSFRYISDIGQGRYSVVKLVEKIDTRQKYAMKIINKSFLLQQDKMLSAITERNVLSQTYHPFIINVDYAFQSPTAFYFCMEYMKGGDLFNYMKRHPNLKFDEIRLLAAEIAIAIHYLHTQKIIYRDLKPENILLTDDGHIKLIDFNLSKQLTSETTQSFCGTIDYLAPEIAMKKPYGKSVDWWSFGILLFEMTFHRTPFHTQNQARTLSKIASANFMIPNCADDDLVSLIEGLLRKDQDKRFCFKDIVNHPFFHSLDFDDVQKMRYHPLNMVQQRQQFSVIQTSSSDFIDMIDDSLPTTSEYLYVPDFDIDNTASINSCIKDDS